jgi:hypothetical protein
MGHGDARIESFDKWTRKWTAKRGPGFPRDMDLSDPDFRDFLEAACEHLGVKSTFECEPEALACILYHMSMEYNEEHATIGNERAYHRPHAA